MFHEICRGPIKLSIVRLSYNGMVLFEAVADFVCIRGTILAPVVHVQIHDKICVEKLLVC